MEKGDIVKIKLHFGGYAIGVVESISDYSIRLKPYFYENKLFLRSGFATDYTIMPLEPIDDFIFDGALIAEGYSYDVETKTIIHEL